MIIITKNKSLLILLALLLVFLLLNGCSNNNPAKKVENISLEEIENNSFYSYYVGKNLEADNHLQVSEADLEVLKNPLGIGHFIYVNNQEVFDGEKIFCAWIVHLGKAYPLNGNSKQLTPTLKFLIDVNKNKWKRTNINHLKSPKVKTLFEKILLAEEEKRNNYVKNVMKKIEKEKDKTNRDKENVKERKITDKDKKIYYYMESIWDHYENKYGLGSKESTAHVLINTYQKFDNIQLVDILISYQKVTEKKSNIDNKLSWSLEKHRKFNINLLKSLDFKLKNGQWHYEGLSVKDY